MGLGNVYIQQGEYKAAIEILQRVLDKVPDSPETYFALGEAYARSGDVASACEAYGHFLELDSPPARKEMVGQAMIALSCP